MNQSFEIDDGDTESVQTVHSPDFVEENFDDDDGEDEDDEKEEGDDFINCLFPNQVDSVRARFAATKPLQTRTRSAL